MAGCAGDYRFKTELPALHIRRPPNEANPRGGNALQPHGLPDPGGAGIPNRVRLQLPILLAAGLREIGRVVFGPDHDGLRPLWQKVVGDVRKKGRIAAGVFGREFAVDPNPGAVIDRAEMQDQSLAINQQRCLKGAAVPDIRVKAGIGNAARFRLGAEGNHDLAIPDDVVRRAGGRVMVQSEIPFAVERDPFGALELWTWIAVRGRFGGRGHEDGRVSTSAGSKR